MDVVKHWWEGYHWWTINWGHRAIGNWSYSWFKTGPVTFVLYDSGGRAVYAFNGRWRWERGASDA